MHELSGPIGCGYMSFKHLGKGLSMLRGILFIAPMLALTSLVSVAHCQEVVNTSDSPQWSSGPTIVTQKPAGPRKPPVGLSTEWITDSQFGLVTTEATTTLPLLFLGTPPPLVKVGFAYTDLFAQSEFDLPDDLYEYTIGLSWFRKINDRWTVRTMIGVGLATDNQNTSSEAYQFRGGMFAIYEKTEQLSWTLGAIALGRDDLPVVPAIGAVWMPNPTMRWDLTFPKPRLNVLLSETNERQRWAYFGAGINGTTWGYEKTDTTGDRLTYKDIRVVIGWESRPASAANLPFAPGKTTQAEIGYVFSRELEFDDESRVEPLVDSFMFGVSTKF